MLTRSLFLPLLTADPHQQADLVKTCDSTLALTGDKFRSQLCDVVVEDGRDGSKTQQYSLMSYNNTQAYEDMMFPKASPAPNLPLLSSTSFIHKGGFKLGWRVSLNELRLFTSISRV
ncbi:hypothetical protein RRG08_067364 [Elysia crispata]|uniref:Uncharacterized protein n=1 Tax=Elysia crispata TaxID=231223 RepID=A0AAE0Z6W5_9GAST|nr:hypothetical protein RRG08_067364 [Elysia crispata]